MVVRVVPAVEYDKAYIRVFVPIRLSVRYSMILGTRVITLNANLVVGMVFFVVHEHWATRHHFDFRLEMDGVLKSWAVPKGPPLESGVKRLAIAVEDHAIEYGSFEGNIPEGEYGAGKVSIWDRGDYVLRDRSPRKITVQLQGKKLEGEYELVLMREERGKQQWLLFKRSSG
jgi:DNA ligase D-like protein (predicted 3'-phosphoesterase)